MYRVPHRIETERLVIRRYTAADAPALHEVTTRNVEHLRQYMEWIKFEPQTLAQREEFVQRVNAEADAGTDFTLGMFLHDGTFIGGTGFHVRTEPDRLEIGYWIDAAHEGRGLVTEAAAALTWVGLRVAGAEIVDIAHAPSNTRSAAIPERLGYDRQAASGSGCFDGGCHEDAVLWWATAETLEREPLAGFAPPRVWDAQGALLS